MENSSVLSHIKEFSEDRNYWLFRTMGGDFYDEFVRHGFIAIGYNEVSLDEIKLAHSMSENASEKLSSIVESKGIKKDNGEDKSPSYISSQLLRFYSEIKEGDVVVIPGPNSDFVSIGYIKSKPYSDDVLYKTSGICDFTKRRKVRFLKKLFRSKLNPKLIQLFNSRHTISNANEYSEYIDCCISDFFQKEDKTYIVLKVKQEDEISAIDFALIGDLIQILSEYSLENPDRNINVNDIKMKVCVQSPGDIIAWCHNPEVIFILGFIILLLRGGKLQIKDWVNIETKGGFENFASGLKTILSSVSDFYDRKQLRDRKDLSDKMKNMKIDAPEDLSRLLDDLGRINEDKDEKDN